MTSSEKDEGVMSNEEDEGEGRESDGDHNDGDEEALDSTSEAPKDDHPFIVPKIWTVNDFCRRCRTKFLKPYKIVTKFQTTSQSTSLGCLRSATRGRLRTLACMMPCSQQD